MAYNTRFIFHFETMVSHRAISIIVMEDGYNGAVVSRAIGGSPLLRRDSSGCVCGTSLEWAAECLVDEEFASLYTTDPKKYKVNLYDGITLIWTGFLSTELYSDPDIAPPYDVTLTATDGLGELKNVQWAGMSPAEWSVNVISSFDSILKSLLSETGNTLPVYYASELKQGSSDFFSTAFTNLENYKDASCYDVLTAILESCHATISYTGRCWIILRETDFDYYPDAEEDYDRFFPKSYQLSDDYIDEYGLLGLTIGRYMTCPNWVINQLSREVVPARKKVVVDAPSNYRVSGFPFQEVAAEDEYGWYANGTASSWVSSGEYFNIPKNGMLVQTLNAFGSSGMRQPLTLKLAFANTNQTAVTIQVTIREVETNSTIFYLYKPADGTQKTEREGRRKVVSCDNYSWSSSVQTNTFTIEPNSDGNDKNSTQLQFDIPISTGARGTHPMELRVEVKNTTSSNLSVRMTSASLNVAGELNGFKSIVNLDNGARGEDETHTSVLFSNVDDQIGSVGVYRSTEAVRFMHGVMGNALGTDILKTFSTRHLAATDWNSLMAQDYALSVALPRLRKTGTVNVGTMPNLPVHARCFRDETETNELFLIETFSWDILNEEMEVSIIKLPAASITIESSKLIED